MTASAAGDPAVNAVENDVDSGRADGRGNLARPRGPAVVDRNVGPERARKCELAGTTRRGDDRRARALRELDQQRPDTARGRFHENAFAGSYPDLIEQSDSGPPVCKQRDRVADRKPIQNRDDCPCPNR